MINDWLDFVGVCALSFLIITISVWMLPQLREETRFIISILILLSSAFFAKKMADFMVGLYKRHNLNQEGKNGE